MQFKFQKDITIQDPIDEKYKANISKKMQEYKNSSELKSKIKSCLNNIN